MKKENWVWMPHAAHFICGNDCRFVLSTYVGKYIVSTVGEYSPDREVKKIHAESRGVVIQGRGDWWDANFYKKFGFIEVGLDRVYETMVFKAKKSGKDCKGCPYTIESGENIDFGAYNKVGDAFKGHMKLCKKWGKKK